MIFTAIFLNLLRHSAYERGAYEVRGWRRPLLRGVIACTVTDATLLTILVRLILGQCSPLLLVLLLMRGLNPFLSIFYHNYDLNIFNIQKWLTEASVRQIDMFMILVATLTDLSYGAYILLVPNCLPPDVIWMAIVATISQALPQTRKDAMFGLFMLRGAYLGFLHLPEPAVWGIRLALLGIVFNFVDEIWPEWPGQYKGVRKYFGIYDVVHICWFADIGIMLVLGDAGRSNLVGTGW